MARRTKEEAQQTRSRLLDAAEEVFDRHGVSATSLNDIAAAAGVTRGAIYWHFRDKADLFNAMMERVTLPLEEASRLGRGGASSGRAGPAGLEELRAAFVDVLARIVADAQLRRVFNIATHKVEYVDALNAVRERHLQVRGLCLEDIQRALRAAQRRGDLPEGVVVAAAAMGWLAVFDGVLQNWMLDPEAFDLVQVGAQVLDTYLAGLAVPTEAVAR